MKRARTLTKKRRIERQSVPESLRDSLQERILSGEFREGDSLIQDAIATEYDVSRMPVREALRQLEACGLVSMRTHKGAVVTTIPTEQIKELFELRATLECDILRRAIERCTDQDIADARVILGELEESYRRGDVARWGSLNWAFHERLYTPADRVQTLAILQSVNLQTERYIRLHLLLTDGLGVAEREHRELLRLCALRATEQAVAFLNEHILGTGRALLLALRNHRAKAQPQSLPKS
jgi:DNA-binding GntR family transcriptional regulator